MGAAFLGAILGDQTGYFIGRKAGQHVLPKFQENAARAKIIARAQNTIDQRGGLGVFFSTWLFAPLGPYVNLVAGAAGLSWLRFTISDILGEAIWVMAYVGMGYIFVDNLEIVADLASNVIGILIALGISAATLAWIVFAVRAAKKSDEALETDVANEALPQSS
jgi:membrane protein DedA with SNARE-associated domain